MHQIIHSDIIILNLLLKHQAFTTKDLNSLRIKIEKEIPNVFVDVSTNSLINTAISYNNVFSWIGNTFSRLRTVTILDLDKYNLIIENKLLENIINDYCPKVK
jgi:hypothetical protein